MKVLQRLKLALLGGVVMLSVGAAITPTVWAQNSKDQVCQGVDFASGGGGCGGGDADIRKIVTVIINVLSLIGGIAAVIIIIVSGLRLITSAGNADALGQARNGVLYAIVGLIIIAFAQGIVHFVLGRL